jgi:L-iditol 2-dehydrogenase
MRAAVLHDIRDIRLADLPRPVPQDGDVLVQVKAVGVCGSDIHSYVEGSTTGPTKVTPYVLGHELAGVIPAESAKLSGLAVGTLVAVDPARPCMQCEWCHRGHTNLCPHVRFLGYAPTNGALAEFVSVAPSALHPVPPELQPADAAILETLGVAIHAIDLARLRFMETIAVLGCGAVGLLLVQLARLSGAGTIVAVDPLAYRTKLAMEFGADVACNDYSEVAAATDGRRADVVLEATDSASGFDQAVRSSRIGGRLVLVGIPDGNEYTLNAAEARRRGLSIKFSRRMPEVYPRAIALAASGRVDLRPLATHRFTLEDTKKAFEMQVGRNDGIIKAIIYP